MDEPGEGTLEGGAGEGLGGRVPPPFLTALLESMEGEERTHAWRDFLGAYGATLDSVVRHVIARHAGGLGEVRVQDATRWILRQLWSRDLHVLRRFRGETQFTTYLVVVAVQFTRAYLSTVGASTQEGVADEAADVTPLFTSPTSPQRGRRDDDQRTEGGGSMARLPRKVPPPAGGHERWPNGAEMA